MDLAIVLLGDVEVGGALLRQLVDSLGELSGGVAASLDDIAQVDLGGVAVAVLEVSSGR